MARKKKPDPPKTSRGIIEATLEAICNQNGGVLRPDDVVSWAESHPDSELAKKFEWNDGVAAHKYRLDQARHIIKGVYKERESETIQLSVYYCRDPDQEPHDQGYVKITDLEQDKEKARRYIKQELARMRGTLQRLSDQAKVLGMEDRIELFRKEVVMVEQELFEDL